MLDVRRDPERLLDDLTPSQRAAATTLDGPVAIIAGAGSGKTRVISRRAAYAVATGAVDPRRVLILTFTERAAGEMAHRIAVLRLPDVTARTFHAAALLQLRYFWPRLGRGEMPGILGSKIGLVSRIVARRPGATRFLAAKDVADTIEWAKVRRISPDRFAIEASNQGRELPADPQELVRLWEAYEAAKRRDGVIDFEDMLEETLRILETDEEASADVHRRYAWFSVDEYQDTNPLQEALLTAWLGERRDLCVVGDPDQSIYSFSGATPSFLLTFRERHRGAKVIDLRENFRSTPEVIERANRLLAAVGRPRRLIAVRPAGGSATIRRFDDGDAEGAAIAADIRRLQEAGVSLSETAILVRLNAQVADWEEILRQAGLPFTVRGGRFFRSADVRRAIGVLHRLDAPMRAVVSADLSDRVANAWKESIGFDRGATPATDAARERQAALEALLAIADGLGDADDGGSIDALLAEIARRQADEESPMGTGVTLSTIHRAKGLEWDAVYLPGWEEGLLPYRSAMGKPDEIAEERRLAYVGVTRARTHLWVSCAARRAGPGGTLGGRVASRFFTDLEGLPRERRAMGGPGAGSQGPARPSRSAGCLPDRGPVDARPGRSAPLRRPPSVAVGEGESRRGAGLCHRRGCAASSPRGAPTDLRRGPRTRPGDRAETTRRLRRGHPRDRPSIDVMLDGRLAPYPLIAVRHQPDSQPIPSWSPSNRWGPSPMTWIAGTDPWSRSDRAGRAVWQPRLDAILQNIHGQSLRTRSVVLSASEEAENVPR